MSGSRAAHDGLPGTAPLTWEGDLAARMVDGIRRFGQSLDGCCQTSLGRVVLEQNRVGSVVGTDMQTRVQALQGFLST